MRLEENQGWFTQQKWDKYRNTWQNSQTKTRGVLTSDNKKVVAQHSATLTWIIQHFLNSLWLYYHMRILYIT